MARPDIQSVALTNTNAVLTWSAIPGAEYRVQFKNDLSDTTWTDLLPDVTASGPAASLTDTPGAPQRFYRVLVVR
jgi:hypothetical protein